MKQKPQVIIMVGSTSDLVHYKKSDALKIFQKCGIDVVEPSASSAHRNPEDTSSYVKAMANPDIPQVFICAAGMSAALPGTVAAAIAQAKPMLAVPLPSTGFENCMDSFISAWRMPPGVAVSVLDNFKNAAIAACQILAQADENVRKLLDEYLIKNTKKPMFNLTEKEIELLVEGKNTLADGKTQRVWEYKNNVLIVNKDDITAGDGEKHDFMPGKGIVSSETTCNCFGLLNSKGIPTHFIERVDRRSFTAKKGTPIRIECVTRRIATGSYLKRNPDTVEGEIFSKLTPEFYWKDDDLHDPIMIWDSENEVFNLYLAKKPISDDSFIKQMTLEEVGLTSEEDLKTLGDLTPKVFEITEEAWKQLDTSLVDFKIEFMYDENGNIIMADVLNNDSWRIWPGGQKINEASKQVYRDLKGGLDPKALGKLKSNYEWVMEQTAKFAA